MSSREYFLEISSREIIHQCRVFGTPDSWVIVRGNNGIENNRGIWMWVKMEDLGDHKC